MIDSKKGEGFNLYDNAKAKSNILAVGGGKGGVGRSFISSSLSILLAKMGYKTILVDLDLGAQNLHTYLGEGLDSYGVSHFLSNSKKGGNLQDVCIKTKIPRLWFIGGSQDGLDIANISEAETHDLISAIYGLEADFTVLDLSAGTSSRGLDLFLTAQKPLVVVTPDPSSIENAYRFMKAVFFRKMKTFQLNQKLKGSLDKMIESCTRFGRQSPADFLSQVFKAYPERRNELSNFTKNLQFNIILNQVQTLKDVHFGRSIINVCKKYFGLPFHFLGYIEYNNAVWRSLRKKKPLLVEYPQSHLYVQILSIARNLAYPQEQQKSIVEWDFKVS